MNWDSLPTQEFSKKPMNLTATTDAVMMFCILAAMSIFDAVLTLLSIFKKGVCINQRDLLIKKTNKELKAMLTGATRISNLNKKQLVNLILVS